MYTVSRPLTVALPRRTRLIGSSIVFLMCLGGLYWTDYLESKYQSTPEQKERIEDMRKLRFPRKGDFEEAREQAIRAQALGKGDPKK
jgi:hypothetical protein